MSCTATLTQVFDEPQTLAKLPAWTADDPVKIISDVKSGIPRLITTLNCDGCKKDLEQNHGAVVVVGK